MTKDEALDLALEALESYKNFIEDAHIIEGQWHWIDGADQAITAIKQARSAPVQEPVAWMDRDGDLYANEPDKNWCPPHYPLYTTPPAAQRQWVGLTDEEITDIWAETTPYYHEDDFARAIEAKLKKLNT
jgi:hypothetical protein